MGGMDVKYLDEYRDVQEDAYEFAQNNVPESWFKDLTRIDFRAKNLKYDIRPPTGQYDVRKKMININTPDCMTYGNKWRWVRVRSTLIHELAHHAHLTDNVQFGEGLEKSIREPYEDMFENNISNIQDYVRDIPHSWNVYSERLPNAIEFVAVVAQEHIAHGERFASPVYDLYYDLDGPRLP